MKTNKASTSGTKTVSSEEKYRQLIEFSPIPMAIHVMGEVVLVNQSAAELIGATKPDELIGTNVMKFVHPDSRKDVEERIRLLIQGKRQHTEALEEKLIRMDGEVIDVEIVSLLIEYDNKPSIQLILHDVTEKKRVEKKLVHAKNEAEAERRRLYNLFMDAPAMVAIVNGPEHIFELANPLYLKVTGKSSDIIGRTVKDVFPELQGQGIFELLDKVRKTDEPFLRTEVLMKLDVSNTGTPQDVYFNFVYQPSRNGLGEVDSIMVHAIDVTPQVLARREIENRQKQYRSIFESTHDAILVFNKTGQLIEANPAALNMYEYSLAEMNTLHSDDFLHPDDSVLFKKIVKSIAGNKPFHGTGKHRKKDGTPMIVEITGTAVTYGQEHHVMTVVRDITERKRAEDDLNYANTLLQTVTNNASLGLLMMDDRQHCTFMNSAAEKITGYSFAEVQELNRPLHDIIHHSHPDGTPYAMADCPIDRALPQKNRKTGEDVFVRPDGTFYPVRFTASPLVKDGQPAGTIIEAEDLTERLKNETAYLRVNERRRELEKITAALKEQQVQLLALNKSKDEFISLASHQLRTPATGVKQYVAMALEGYAGELSSDLRLYLERAYESNERQLTIVNDLLKVAQVDAGKVRLQKETFDIAGMIEAILRDSASKFKERRQKVIFSHSEKPVPITADENRLRMAIENIVDNASKYTASGKTIKIRVSLLRSSVRIAIKDEGVGIKHDDIEKIFQKFIRLDNPFSTEVGGTGLGLYWTERIINLHGGAVSVKSTIGAGSTFTVELPL